MNLKQKQAEKDLKEAVQRVCAEFGQLPEYMHVSYRTNSLVIGIFRKTPADHIIGSLNRAVDNFEKLSAPPIFTPRREPHKHPPGRARKSPTKPRKPAEAK